MQTIFFKVYFGFFILFSFLGLSSCGNENETEKTEFDRKELLENVATNLIIPSYQNLEDNTDLLVEATQNFTQNPSVSTLETAQTAWKAAYLSFQDANAYNFGAAQGTLGSLLENVGTFPVSETKLENYITAGNSSFDNFDRDSRGFLGAEYLLFDKENTADVVEKYTDQNRKDYLLAVVENIQTEVTNVNTSWTTGYKETFTNNTGTDAGSGVSILFNEWSKSFESIKNFKLGLPLGRRAGQTQADPTLVEAYYSKESILFLKAHFENIERVWYGKSLNGQDGIGFEEYLLSVEGGEAIVLETKAQLEEVEKVINLLPNEDLQTQITSNSTPINNLLTEMQKLTRFLKSEMISLLGITITYDSGDGD
ncbi:putative periplasmic lipoprotein [Bernardetia litoralis DSM 6794]|uniref:Putative periplasmic lipoprotein n=1 Tax=Bernardetia litoralis (strain ATCC 23117 / DSM 6794 / NBRC 15988 / NCIMB 1366 / Fx l1 / Sio-4) TaxID=880071 RepID=I4AQV8_BERLS|nr:imelysin family protein [Bernardetia litoralis]AFM06343.1 putative periplasmic lipoprotein [Bernardetia litoralis DSM 6794]